MLSKERDFRAFISLWIQNLLCLYPYKAWSLCLLVEGNILKISLPSRNSKHKPLFLSLGPLSPSPRLLPTPLVQLKSRSLALWEELLLVVVSEALRSWNEVYFLSTKYTRFHLPVVAVCWGLFCLTAVPLGHSAFFQDNSKSNKLNVFFLLCSHISL